MARSGRLFRLYLEVYQAAVWVIERSGPLAPTLVKISGRLQSALVPRSYSVPNPVYVDNLCVYHTEAPLAARLLAMGLYERDMLHTLRKHVRVGMTVLDVGANVGLFSLVAAQIVGETGAVWSFEPVPHVLNLLRTNVERNRLTQIIHVVPSAVGNVARPLLIYVDTEASGWSSFYEDAFAGQTGHASSQHQALEVVCTTLDQWAAEHDWPRVDFMKMDIEGAESAALEGMRELSRRNPHLRLIVEFNARTLAAAGTDPLIFFERLHQCHFDRISLIEDPLRPLRIPDDVAALLAAMTPEHESVNLLCEKSST